MIGVTGRTGVFDSGRLRQPLLAAANDIRQTLRAQCTAREVEEEETGYRPHLPLEHLVTFEPMIGMATCPHHVFLARSADRISEPAEKTEMQRMEWIPLADVPGLIARGMVRSSGTLVALLSILSGLG